MKMKPEDLLKCPYGHHCKEYNNTSDCDECSDKVNDACWKRYDKWEDEEERNMREDQ